MRFLIAFFLFCLLVLFCWPLALLLLILLPLAWLVCLPFRVGFWLIEGILSIIRGILLLPGRILNGFKS